MPDHPLRLAVLARSVHPLHGVGGLERHVHDLVVHLARRGLEITLITPPPRDPHAALTLPARLVTVPYVTFPGAGRRGTTVVDRATAYPVFGWRAGQRAAALVRTGLVDVVHGLGASVLGYAMARRRDPALQAPLILNPQGLEEFGATRPDAARLKRLVYRPLQVAVRACAHAADAVIATDASLRPVVIAHLGVPESRVVTIPNAIDLDAVDALAGPADGAAIRAAHGIAPQERLFVSTGRLEQNKGFHVLIDALARLGGRLEHWRWVLVGDGPWRHRLGAIAAGAGLASRIIMPGRLDDARLHAWYEAADVFVHPTLYEGSSLVTLEAMAHRRAVVATRAGGLPDKVRPGQNGWLVAPGDAAALCEALRDAAGDRDRLGRLGECGRRIVEAEFAWTAVAATTEALYRRLLAPPGAPEATARRIGPSKTT